MSDFFFILDDPELWKSVAFFISLALIVVPIYKFLIRVVQKRSKQISEQMSKALELRNESEKMLRDIQRKNFYKDTERKKILQKALKEARILKEDANKTLEERLQERKEEILTRVRLIRQTGLNDLREKVVSIAVDTTEKILQNSQKDSQKSSFMDAGIQELECILNQKEQKEQLLKAVLNE